MSAFVLDSSVALSWVFEDEFSAYSDFVISRFDESEVHVPSLWWLEVLNTLILAERKGRLSAESFAKAFAEVRALSVITNPWNAGQLEDVARAGRRYSLTSYDATYLALRIGAPLATLDQWLAEAARAAGCFLAIE